MPGLKNQQNATNEAIEGVKIQRLQTKLAIEQEGLRGDQIDLQKAKIGTQIKGESLKQENIKLTSAKVSTQIEGVLLGKTQDKLGYETADRVLTQQEYAAKLQLKSINVAALREEVRHAGVLHGGGSSGISFNNTRQSVPKFSGGQNNG